MEEFLAQLPEMIVSFGLKLLGALVIVVIGRWLAGILARHAEKAMERTNTSVALVRFVRSLTYWGVFILALVVAFGVMGVQTATFAAVIAAAGLAIGLALQGALGNFASGVLILIFRPFDVGQLVEIADHTGVVEEIQIFSTILVTPENKTIIIPNGQVTSGSIVNYTKKGTLRIDLVFGIGYDDDLAKAKQILQEMLEADDRVLADPAPEVTVLELADSSVNFAVRPFVKVEDYWSVYFTMQEQVKLRFDAENISIPYPQQDVHLFQPNPN